MNISMGKLILGSLLGGAVLFAWGMVSWMVLPWHNSTLTGFKNEDQFEEVLKIHAPEKGVYVFPGMCHFESNLSEAEKKAMMEKSYEKMEKGPYVFAVVSPNGSGSMTKCMIFGFIIQCLGAMLVTWLLSKTNFSCYMGRVIFTVVFGLGAGVVCFLPGWNWWGFPLNYTIVSMLDLIAGWFLAGLVLAKLTSSCCDEVCEMEKKA